MLRKLLYHRGIDDEFATYVTDYIAGVFCLVYATIYLGNLIYFKMTIVDNSKCKKPLSKSASFSEFLQKEKYQANHEKRSVTEKRSLEGTRSINMTTFLMFFFCGLMLILGGFVHRNVQGVAGLISYNKLFFTSKLINESEFVESVFKPTLKSKKELRCLYLTWQIANISAGLCASSLFLLISLYTKHLQRYRQTLCLNGSTCVYNTSKLKLRVRVISLVVLLLSISCATVTIVAHIKNILEFYFSISKEGTVLEKWLQNSDRLERTAQRNLSYFLLSIKQNKLSIITDEKIKFTFENIESSSLTNQIELDTEIEILQTHYNFLGLLDDPKTTVLGLNDDSLKHYVAKYSGLNYNEIWANNGALVLFGVAIFSYSCFATFILFVQILRRRTCLNKITRQSERIVFEINKSSSAEEGLMETSFDLKYLSSEESKIHQKEKRQKLSSKNRKLITRWGLKGVGAWTVMSSGFFQFGLASQCAGINSMECPFPKAFNHNALFHVLLLFGISLLFVGDMLYFSLTEV